MAKKKTDDNVKLIRSTTERLPVQLTEQERLVFADRLAHCEAELAEFAADAESQKRQLKAREAAILSRRAELAGPGAAPGGVPGPDPTRGPSRPDAAVLRSQAMSGKKATAREICPACGRHVALKPVEGTFRLHERRGPPLAGWLCSGSGQKPKGVAA